MSEPHGLLFFLSQEGNSVLAASKQLSAHVAISASCVCVQCLPCKECLRSSAASPSCGARPCWAIAQNQTKCSAEPGCLRESPGLLGNPVDPPIPNPPIWPAGQGHGLRSQRVLGWTHRPASLQQALFPKDSVPYIENESICSPGCAELLARRDELT